MVTRLSKFMGGTGTDNRDTIHVDNVSKRFGIATNNPVANLHILTSDENSTAFAVESISGSAIGVRLNYYHNSPSPTTNDQISSTTFSANNASASKIDFLTVNVYSNVVTAGSEDVYASMLSKSSVALEFKRSYFVLHDNLHFATSNVGIQLRSPNGNTYLITVSDNGSLQVN